MNPMKTEIKEEEWEPLRENTSGETRPGEIKRKSERVKTHEGDQRRRESKKCKHANKESLQKLN